MTEPSLNALDEHAPITEAALTASRFDPRFRTFKEHLLAAGKARKLVIVTCARKLLTVLNAMMRTGTTYLDAAA